MSHRLIARVLVLGSLLFLGLVGCGQEPESKETKPTECSFVLPLLRENIQDYVEYTGRTAAVGSVDIKARVTGFLLDTQFFKEGETVHKGQQLFQIDPEPYIAQLEQAKAQVGLYQAQLDLNTKTYEQKLATRKRNPDAVTELDLRTSEAQKKEAQAALDAAKASLKVYEINKKYTAVTSPIDGVVGRRNQTPGNIIIQDQTLLTTVVSLEKMYVYFDMDAPTYALFHPGKDEKPVNAPVTLEPPVASSTASATQPSAISGVVNFFNNQFNPATDTILVRGLFDNPTKTERGARLRPGMFVRVKLSIGQSYKALVVPDRAILSKMGKKYVYVADENDRVKEIPVVIGQLQEEGLRVIKQGQLQATDRVIVSRLLDIQPNQEIQPVLQQAPTAK